MAAKQDPSVTPKQSAAHDGLKIKEEGQSPLRESSIYLLWVPRRFEFIGILFNIKKERHHPLAGHVSAASRRVVSTYRRKRGRWRERGQETSETEDIQIQRGREEGKDPRYFGGIRVL